MDVKVNNYCNYTYILFSLSFLSPLDVRGGGLLSTLYLYAQHGDLEVMRLVKHLLNQVSL